eukprot:GFKZ01001472.1.p1 GENE.GFKZ01001472.1~~GFKZ01001472.1.p1  ORF type:complete len:179 (-),score=1.16 GFKZ01001472.1:143-679(-)
MQRSFLLFGLLLLVTKTSACSCIRQNFAESYNNAETVVFAKVLRVRVSPPPSPPACLSQIPPCLIPIRLFEPIIYRLRLVRIFKGCGPSMRPIFFARSTIPNGANCGIRLRRGITYMLNLGAEIPQLPGSTNRFFSLNICQQHRRVSVLSARQRRFLRIMSMKPRNRCMAAIDVLSEA